MTMNDAMDEVFNRRHAPRQLDDSERNQLSDLAGEADEPCAICGEPVRPSLRGGLHNIVEYWEFTLDEDGEQPVHEECYDAAKEQHLEEQAEARLDRRYGIGW